MEQLGWKFSPNPIGRRLKAEKIVNGQVIHTITMCCLNRLLIQVQAWEASHGNRRP